MGGLGERLTACTSKKVPHLVGNFRENLPILQRKSASALILVHSLDEKMKYIQQQHMIVHSSHSVCIRVCIM